MGRLWWRLPMIVAAISLLGLALPVAAGGDGGRKIVTFEKEVTAEDQEALLQEAGATGLKRLPMINGWAIASGPGSELKLHGRRGVLRVEEDAVAFALKKGAPQPSETLPWGVNRIDAELAWGAGTGVGVKLAVVDTGIDLKHPDLAANIKGGVNTINPLRSANDDNGHGTHVAGTIAAIDNTVGVVGVAPGASLYAVKVLGASGSGYVSDIIEGIQWSIANGMDVINMSLGTTSDVQALHDALIAAHNAGIVLVAAAGNAGPGEGTVHYPGAYPEVIAVAATDSSDNVAYYSSRGPEVDLAAPGSSIYSTYKGGGYKTLSGTSMASPHVAGTAALVLATPVGARDANGNGVWDVEEVRAALVATADDLGLGGWDSATGYGLVDAQEAVTGVQTLP